MTQTTDSYPLKYQKAEGTRTTEIPKTDVPLPVARTVPTTRTTGSIELRYVPRDVPPQGKTSTDS